MPRRLFTLLSALSLLLCVAVCVLWVRGTRASDVVHVRTDKRWFVAASAGEHLLLGNWLTRDHDPSRGRKGARPFTYSAERPAVMRREFNDYQRRAVRHHALAGFHYLNVNHSIRIVAVPWWPMALVTATPPALWVRRLLHRRVGRVRLQHGLCPSCRYDLRATPGRCPECGAVPAAPKRICPPPAATGNVRVRPGGCFPAAPS